MCSIVIIIWLCVDRFVPKQMEDAITGPIGEYLRDKEWDVDNRDQNTAMTTELTNMVMEKIKGKHMHMSIYYIYMQFREAAIPTS
jgi:hypothetical protein